MTNRREFLQTTAAIAGSLVLPKAVLATSAPKFHFLHADPANTGLSLTPFNGRFKTPLNRSWLVPPKGCRS